MKWWWQIWNSYLKINKISKFAVKPRANPVITTSSRHQTIIIRRRRGCRPQPRLWRLGEDSCCRANMWRFALKKLWRTPELGAVLAALAALAADPVQRSAARGSEICNRNILNWFSAHSDNREMGKVCAVYIMNLHVLLVIWWCSTLRMPGFTSWYLLSPPCSCCAQPRVCTKLSQLMKHYTAFTLPEHGGLLWV